ncbi:hypothetical protein [Planococcus glaciei]|uniref:hypothetical protein n=1 Tax=Planococcus glaciei TaxID=459472 RepID=UPI001C72D578|nr:hypothetical protein [Planococcus glaciei]MBX0314162.1 hypothetical protein [Planococcus glaciei]
MIPTKKDFALKLQELKSLSKQMGEPHLLVTSGALHKVVGGYDTTNHRMASCCNAMYDAMESGDEIIEAPPKGKGARLTVKYFLQ